MLGGTGIGTCFSRSLLLHLVVPRREVSHDLSHQQSDNAATAVHLKNVSHIKPGVSHIQIPGTKKRTPVRVLANKRVRRWWGSEEPRDFISSRDHKKTNRDFASRVFSIRKQLWSAFLALLRKAPQSRYDVSYSVSHKTTWRTAAPTNTLRN